MPGCRHPGVHGLVAAFAALLLSSACSDGPAETGPQVSAGPKPGKISEGTLPPEFVAAVSAGGNSSAISVHFAIRNAPTVSQALPVDIAIVPHQTFTVVRAHFDSRDGLAVATGNQLGSKSDPKPEKPIKHELVLMPARDGVFMVSAVIETEGLDGTITRVFSIPVIVAPGTDSPPAPTAAPDAPPPASG